MENKPNCNFVIKIYEIKKTPLYGREDDVPYAEVHRVMNSNGKRIISAGVPLSESFFRDMFFFKEIHSQTENKISIFPEYLLYHGFNNKTEYIAWWRRSCIQYMDFSKGFKSKLKCGQYPVPPMVFILKNRKDLLAYALKSNKRPVMNTKIYHPPFPNVYTTKTAGLSNICMGSSKINADTDENIYSVIQKAEIAWWKSEFNAHLDISSARKDEDLLEAKKTGKFPMKSLIDTKLWLKDVF